jgi:4'-phosphopantetheinyl transferase
MPAAAILTGDLPPLERDAAVVALFDLPPRGPFTDALERELPPAERDRARRYRVPAARARFVAARWMLRAALAQYTGRAPAAIEIVVGPRGKPQLARGGIAFNVSHSGGMGAIALAPAAAVGVDVERVAPARVRPPLERRCLTTGELAHAARLAPADRARAFFTTWTLKEAAAKALGVGFALDFRSFAARGADGRPVRLACGVSAASVPAGPGYAAAVASSSPLQAVRVVHPIAHPLTAGVVQ